MNVSCYIDSPRGVVAPPYTRQAVKACLSGSGVGRVLHIAICCMQCCPLRVTGAKPLHCIQPPLCAIPSLLHSPAWRDEPSRPNHCLCLRLRRGRASAKCTVGEKNGYRRPRNNSAGK